MKLPAFTLTAGDSIYLKISGVQSSEGHTFMAYKVAQAWEESDVTFNNQPTIGPEFVTLDWQEISDDVWVVNITGYLEVLNSEFGFVLYNECNYSLGYPVCWNDIYFLSSDSDDSTRRPTLLIYR